MIRIWNILPNLRYGTYPFYFDIAHWRPGVEQVGLGGKIKNQVVHLYNTRRSNDLRLPLPRTNWDKQTFIYQAAKDWNSVPTDLKETHLLSIFKSKLKTFLQDFD